MSSTTLPQSLGMAAEPGLLYPLSENNAPRSCADCGDDADFYTFLDGVVSKFLCRDCYRNADRESPETGD